MRCGRALIAVLGLFALSSCDPELPIVPVNHSPVLRALEVFPVELGRRDSAVVICVATDADGDSLRYGWFAGGPVRFSTPLELGPFGFESPSNRIVVHADTAFLKAPLDTIFVSCTAYDERFGRSQRSLVLIEVKQ